MNRDLSDRLCKLCEVTPTCDSLADIGCDHGYVSIELVKTGKAKRVLAMDVNEGPLERAKENIASAGLSDVIETRLSDGLHNVENDRLFDTILIAGMGGRLIRDILSEGSAKVSKATCLVLQPQSEIFLVREYVLDAGFVIESEYCVKDRGKFYFILICRRSKSKVCEADPFFFEYSRKLLEERDEVYRQYLSKSLEAVAKYLEQAGDRSDKLKADKENIIRALSFYEETDYGKNNCIGNN
ncbi:MAG: class I SAM-dependent methyltransferase [Lachnospiraceae bacterium]|nr:class I SAM-dependent methyltransferase [Lachnospiraceae bacterium]